MWTAEYYGTFTYVYKIGLRCLKKDWSWNLKQVESFSVELRHNKMASNSALYLGFYFLLQYLGKKFAKDTIVF